MSTEIKYPAIGICGLGCRLCPLYHSTEKSRCGGCKSEGRMRLGCSFITCALKRKGIEFCWDCEESSMCEKWRKHREFSKKHDSFVCYQKLEDGISFVQQHGIEEFERRQKRREKLLKEMLGEFNEGRSRTRYCVAANVLEIVELEEALERARESSKGLDVRGKSKVLHSVLDEIAVKKKYLLKLRKWKK